MKIYEGKLVMLHFKSKIVAAFLISIILHLTTITSGTTCLEVVNISGGEDHTLVLTQNKTVFSCGANGYGQLGVDDQVNRTILEQSVDGDMYTFSGYLEGIIVIDAGWKHSLALEDPCGFVWSWGSDGQGQLGDGDGVSSSLTPASKSRRTKSR